MNDNTENEAPDLFDRPESETAISDCPENSPAENLTSEAAKTPDEVLPVAESAAESLDVSDFPVPDASVPVNAQILPPVPPKPYRTVPQGRGFGETLRQLRETCQLSIDEVSEQTKLRASYIKAMEAEDFDHLPQLVFVLAYAKKLGALYEVNPEEFETLLGDLREKLSFDLPEDISKAVADRELDEENASRIRRLLFIFILGVIFVIFLIGTILTLLFTGLSRGAEEPILSLKDDSALVELQDKPQLKTTGLKL